MAKLDINELINRYYKKIIEKNLDMMIIDIKVSISKSGGVNVIECREGAILSDREAWRQ